MDNENIESDLLRAMHLSGVNYKRTDEFGNETVNKARVRDTLYNHGAKNMAAENFPQAKIVGFMSKPTFNTWWNGQYHKRLHGGNFAILMSFINQYKFDKEYSA